MNPRAHGSIPMSDITASCMMSVFALPTKEGMAVGSFCPKADNDIYPGRRTPFACRVDHVLRAAQIVPVLPQNSPWEAQQKKNA